MSMSNISLARQISWFAIAGTLGFVVDVCLLYATAGLFGWYGGRVFSFLGAATTTWVINRRWTFRSTHSSIAYPASTEPLFKEYLKYLSSMLGGAAFNYGTFVLVMHYASSNAIPNAPILGVMAGSIAGLFANFLAARYWVFRSNR